MQHNKPYALKILIVNNESTIYKRIEKVSNPPNCPSTNLSKTEQHIHPRFPIGKWTKQTRKLNKLSIDITKKSKQREAKFKKCQLDTIQIYIYGVTLYGSNLK